MAVPTALMCPISRYEILTKLTPTTRSQTLSADAIKLLQVQVPESHPTHYLLPAFHQPRQNKCSCKQKSHLQSQGFLITNPVMLSVYMYGYRDQGTLTWVSCNFPPLALWFVGVTALIKKQCCFSHVPQLLRCSVQAATQVQPGQDGQPRWKQHSGPQAPTRQSLMLQTFLPGKMHTANQHVVCVVQLRTQSHDYNVANHDQTVATNMVGDCLGIMVKDKYTFVVFFFGPHKDNMFPLSPTTNLYSKSIYIYNYINVSNQYFLAQKVLLKDCLGM